MCHGQWMAQRNENWCLVDSHLVQITAESIRGKFRQVLSNTSFLDPEGNVSLGVLTFNQFGPKDLKARLYPLTDCRQTYRGALATTTRQVPERLPMSRSEP